MRLFIMTLRFLTRLPLPFMQDKIVSNEKFAQGIVFYPLVGLIVGLIEFLVYRVACVAGLRVVAEVLCVLSGVFITGAFHLDGLADTCDGLYSSRDRQGMLEIMRDSRIGTNGAVAVVFDSILKIALIHQGGFYFGGAVIFLAPLAAKTVTPVLMKSRYARQDAGLGSIYLKEEYSSSMALAMFLGSSICTLFLGVYAFFPLAVCFAGALVFRLYMEKRLGGMTGDTLGAGSEWAEILFLAAFVAQAEVFLW